MAPWVSGAIFLLFADQWLKFQFHGFGPERVIAIPGAWLSFHFVKNPYIALSIPLGGEWLVYGLILIVFCLLLVIFLQYKKHNWKAAGLLTIIVFCAISNILDRIRYGYVIDYIDVRFFSVFNLADAFIVVAVAWILILRKEWHRETSKTVPSPGQQKQENEDQNDPRSQESAKIN